MTRLKIENLKKTYHDANDLIVLDNLNLTVEQNEFIGVNQHCCTLLVALIKLILEEYF